MLATKYLIFTMNDTYLRAINESTENFQLCIVGKDPFPTSPTGIPFCKTTWREQLSARCSGGHVLRSLGIPSTIDQLFPGPEELFIRLAQTHCVVFLNVCYEFIGSSLRRSRHLTLLQQAYEINRSVLNRSAKVVLCGEASKLRWVAPIDSSKMHIVVHPDIRNRHNMHTHHRWADWWIDNRLQQRFELSIRY